MAEEDGACFAKQFDDVGIARNDAAQKDQRPGSRVDFVFRSDVVLVGIRSARLSMSPLTAATNLCEHRNPMHRAASFAFLPLPIHLVCEPESIRVPLEDGLG